MTFKHAKFEDSVIMRSLEKVARERGMIKDEPMQKQASAPDLKPSNNLMVNILNLCAGLRASGFDKYANELETNFLNYKQATNSLYETDPKAGEKEIETAHPDGSHKLEGVQGDATVETVLDNHLKMLEVSNQDPNGKLESSASVLRAVKKALGAPSNKKNGSALKNAQNFTAELAFPKAAPAATVAKAPGIWGRLFSLVGRAGTGAAELGATEIGGGALGVGASVAGAILIGAIGGILVGNAYFDRYLEPDDIKDAGDILLEKANATAKELDPKAQRAIIDFSQTYNQVLSNYSVLKELKEKKNPADLKRLKSLSDALWASNKHAQTIWGWAQSALDDTTFFGGSLSNLITVANNYMTRSRNLAKLIDGFIYDLTAKVEEELKKNAPAPKPVGTTSNAETQKILQGFDEAINLIKLYKERIAARELKNAPALNDWLDKAAGFATNYKSKLDNSPFKSDPEILSSANKKLDLLKSKLEAFKQKWLS